MNKKKNLFLSGLTRRLIPSATDSALNEESAAHSESVESDIEKRPRNLGVKESLFHLDADWGTSLAYILPIALTLTGRLAPVYMIIIAFIMFVVANGYKVVCRHNPDGGGVYSSLKKVNKFLAVVGALLLITDYIVTQALSVSDAFHYLQLNTLFVQGGVLNFLPEFLKDPMVITRLWTVGILIILTAINWKGPHFSAKFAGFASGPTFFLATLLGIIALPFVPKGLANMGHINVSLFEVLRNTTYVLLALSGVEAISNMTGIMKNPVRTSRRAINIELLKVVFTTLVLGIAINGMPEHVIYDGHFENGNYVYEKTITQRTDFPCIVNSISHKLSGDNYQCPTIETNKARDDMLVAMAEYLVPGNIGKIYGLTIGLIYGLLLIFAGNTALIDITNVTYALARDNELPVGYTKLNKKYGVPIWGLITAGIAPIITVLLIGAKVEALAALYAIGVVGAITLNLSGTTLQVSGKEKIITGFGAVIMGALFMTLAYNKMEATIFASLVLVIGLTARYFQKRFMKNIVHGIEPALATYEIGNIAKGQVLLPVYEEFDPSLYRFVGNYASQVKKQVVLLYLHEVDTILEHDTKHLIVNKDDTTYINKAKNILTNLGVNVHVVLEFTDTIGDTINHYRDKIRPNVTWITPHQQSGIIQFLKGNTIKKVLTHNAGKVLIYSDSATKHLSQ